MIPADKQTAFNRVWNHLRTQRKRAMLDDESGCAYLAPDGSRCAIGVFIPEGHPAQGYEGTVGWLMEEHPDLFEDGCHSGFLSELQEVHDGADTRRPKFRQRLIDVANEYGLTYPKRGWAPGPR